MECKHIKYEGLKRETDRAYLLVIQGQDVWLPKSRATFRKDKRVRIPMWLVCRLQEQNPDIDFGVTAGEIHYYLNRRGFDSSKRRFANWQDADLEVDSMLEDAFHASYW